jgi:Mg-chelatase subunit ChlD
VSPEFTAETFQNEYLPAGATEMHAIVSVAADGMASSSTTTPPASEVVIIIDASGSMNYPRAKMDAAKKATAEAIDCIADGVGFAVIVGYERAEVAYPIGRHSLELAPAGMATRSEAKRVVAKLQAEGGTAMGAWLRQAEQLFGRDAGVIRRAILLTDGRNERETRAELETALDACVGRFQCDCRGVGDDWVVEELREIASRLLGSVDIIPEPSTMAAEFRSMMQGAMAKAVGDVRLRLWTPSGAHVAFVKQVSPDLADLSARRVDIDDRTGEYPTGAWGGEIRDYQVCIHIPAGDAGDEMLAGRISLVVDDEVISQARVRATWTDDVVLSTRICREVAHYTGQAELAEAVQEGLRAKSAGDEATATLRLGRAVQLADAAGDSERVNELGRLVDIDDAATGTVRLKRDVTKLDEMVLETRSVKTMRIVKTPAP